MFVNQESELLPLTYGADLYVVYEPDHRLVHPADQGALLWVRVIRREQRAEATVSYVDDVGGTHPFTATGGRTSIFGEQVVNVDYVDSVERFPGAPDDPGVTPERFLAEVFLVRDTHRRDRAGKDVVEVLGAIKYGWQVEEVR